MLYYLLIGLQIYCLYHAYTTRKKIYWYFIILLAPGLGSAVYLITQVFTKKDAEIVQQEITAVINPTKKIKDLEAKVAFADTFQSRVDLANAYSEMSDFDNAIINYKEALSGSHHQDYYATGQLLEAYYQAEAYEDVITTAQIIKDKPDFETSKAQFLYGLSLSKVGKEEEAEAILKKIDKRYSHYEERLVLAKFYKDTNKLDEAKELLEELITEGDYMTKPNKQLYKTTFLDIQKLHNQLIA
jgi:hypothetical protein